MGKVFPLLSMKQDAWFYLPKLRERFFIKKEAYFIAAGDTFQIWSPEKFEKDKEETNKWLNDQPNDFDPLSFLDIGTDQQ